MARCLRIGGSIFNPKAFSRLINVSGSDKNVLDSCTEISGSELSQRHATALRRNCDEIITRGTPVWGKNIPRCGAAVADPPKSRDVSRELQVEKAIGGLRLLCYVYICHCVC